MSQIKVDTITDGAGTGAPIFPNGIGAISGQTLFANGTAAAPSITNTGDLNTGILFPATDTVAVTTGGSERARIDASGNLLVGKTSTSGAVVGLSLEAIGIIKATRSSNISGYFNRDGSDGSIVSFAKDDITVGSIGAVSGGIYFGSGSSGTERMRIDSSGVVTINNLAGTGSRAVNASATGVLSAASDSRLKEEVPEVSIPSLAEVMLLKPRAYKWLDDIEKRGEDAAVEIGFFADEVKDIIPSAAPMGNDGYYGFYDRSVIAALTRAIQEQQAIIQELTARVAELENTAN